MTYVNIYIILQQISFIMRDLIENCFDCPYSGDKSIIKIWERYNYTTQKTEETHSFTEEDVYDINDKDEYADIAIEWLQDEENYDNGDGEWDEWEFTYFRKRKNSDKMDTIVIRPMKDIPTVMCELSGEYVEQTDDNIDCQVADELNELPIFERYNEKTDTVEKSVEIDENDEDALEAAVSKLRLSSDIDTTETDFSEIWLHYDHDGYLGYVTDNRINNKFFDVYRTVNKKNEPITIRRME